MTDLVERYHRDGFVSPIPVLTAEAASAVARTVDHLAEVSRIWPIRLPFTHQYFRWAYDLAAHPALLAVVERIIGPDILVWGTLILSKPAGSLSKISWHQDCAYTTYLDGVPALSAWIALTPATAESGCMRVIPGSRGDRLPFSTSMETNDMAIRGLRVLAEFDESRAVDLELRPGEASLHEISVIHGSYANRSNLPRTGFIVRYAPSAVQQPPDPCYCVQGSPGAIRCEAPPDARGNEDLTAYLEYLRSESGNRVGAR